MDDRFEPEPPDLTLQLPRSTYWQVVHNLRGMLPPPDTDTPEALAHRDRAAIALVASMLPANADEADIASRCVGNSAYAQHCLRLARVHCGDLSAFLKCTAQAASMDRRACGARSLLQRLQAERRKREANNAATDQAAWTEHCAIGLMADALAEAPPAAAAEPPPANENAEALVAEADLFATMYPRWAAVIRARGGLPENVVAGLDPAIGPPRPALVRAVATGTSPTLRALDPPAPQGMAAAD
ncbi:MAG TPA: hypothetical protein VKI44_06205 [Acetobacteraceae bacterium]|nr:hypothetical protein [Acetobacteraceae bacterium]